MRYRVWVKEDAAHRPGEAKGNWVDNGEGLMTEREAKRIARELCQAGYSAKALPEGVDP
jgi:hypothetical protein